MSPIAPSDSVDAFLTWLAQPANVAQPGHGHATGHGHGPNGLGFVPSNKGKVSDKESEYAARLRELARSPLEEMAKPLLVGGDVPTKSSSEGKTNGSSGKERKERKEKRKTTSSANATSSDTDTDGTKRASSQPVQVQ